MPQYALRAPTACFEAYKRCLVMMARRLRARGNVNLLNGGVSLQSG